MDFLIEILKLLFFLWSPFCFILFNYEPFSALVQSASALQCVWRNYVRQFLILGALSAISHPKRVPGWVNTGVESTMEENPWWSTSSRSRSRTDVFVLQKCKWENMSASWNIASSNAWFFISLPGITNPFWIWTKWWASKLLEWFHVLSLQIGTRLLTALHLGLVVSRANFSSLN